MYSDARVAEVIADHFVPVRVHVRQNAEAFRHLGDRYSAQWTPTILVIDRDGEERHRIEGFLPAEEFMSQLLLGVAHADFAAGRFPDAERAYRQVVERFPNSDAAPEAMYWTGVSRYKESNDPAALTETARRFAERYATTTWAKKASVWAG